MMRFSIIIRKCLANQTVVKFELKLIKKGGYFFMENHILEVLESFRKTLQLDGADLQVSSVGNEKLVLELVIKDETCLDCIVPKTVMSTIIINELKKNGVLFEKFELLYPTKADTHNQESS